MIAKNQMDSRVLVFGTLLVALAFAGSLLVAEPAFAATLTVNQTTDLADTNPGDGACDTSGLLGSQCTLRAAIEEANAAPGTDTINFNIGDGSGVKTIAPSSRLPFIVDTVTINGYSQPGASPNTSTQGTNAVLTIELSGANAGNADGLFLTSTVSGTTSAGSVVKGLAINRFQRSGISALRGARIEGNFIGTDPTGTQDLGNGFSGVNLSGGSSILGGTTPGARNLISGNSGAGVGVGGESDGSKIQGNLIGTKADGTAALGNDRAGVAVGGSNNTVGGKEPGASNTIAFNGEGGVSIGFGVDGDDAATGNRILSNSIFSNSDLGIDLGPEGVTENDRKDPDAGNNGRQNYPTLTSAAGSPETTTLTGTLDSRPRKDFILQFFASPEADASGFGEGKTFLGQKTVKTNRKGKVSFTFTTSGDLSGQSVAATATNKATGDTSEFSRAVTVD